jgi:2-polyprenyl-3-methyl-5-hydroxy-6-metoxy-1,4-benzoquinol methylase
MQKLDDIYNRTLQVYEKHAHAFDTHRSRSLAEQKWLNKFIDLLPSQGSILDIGCGAGEPISEYLLKQGFHLTGLDASSKMLEIARKRFPQANWIKMNMQELKLDREFDGIISWDGFFHLKQEEQRQVLPLFANHLKPNGALLLTIGHESGEVTGTVDGEKVYHSSLASDEYRKILKKLGFDNIEIKLQDESCGFHSILLAKKLRTHF